MGFEDNMIEDGFCNEEDYLEHLINEADKRAGYSRYDEEIDEETLQALQEEEEERIERWRHARMNEEREAREFDCWVNNNPGLAAIWELSPYSCECWGEEYSSSFNPKKSRKACLEWANNHKTNMIIYQQTFTDKLLDEIKKKRLISAYSYCVSYYITRRKVSEYAPILRDWLNENECRKETFFKEIALTEEHDDIYFNSFIWDENINNGTELFYDTILYPGRWDTFFNSIREEDLESSLEQWVLGKYGSNYESFLKEHKTFWMDAKKKQQKRNAEFEIDDYESLLLDEAILDWDNQKKESQDGESKQLTEALLKEMTDWESEIDTIHLRENKSRIDPEWYANKALFDLWKNEDPEAWNSWKKEYIFFHLFHKEYYPTYHEDLNLLLDRFYYIIQNVDFKKTVSKSWIDSHKAEWERFLIGIDYEKYKEEITLASVLDKWAWLFRWGGYYDYPSTSTSFFISFMERFINRKPELISILDKELSDEFENYIRDYFGGIFDSNIMKRVLAKMEENSSVKEYVEAMFNVYLARKYDILDPELLGMKNDYRLY